jgi:amidase
MRDAVELVQLIRSRQLSCVEVMSGYLAHLEAHNAAVNAIVACAAPEALLAEAAEHDAQLTRGEPVGALHGLPHAVKDLQAVRGMRTTMGSPLLADFVPHADSLMVARLRRAGAIFIGKTNTAEFGLGSHTYNPVYGITRNPYDSSRSAGGSSGGAAAALALRMVPLADGSDYGGSLRNPAGWNALYGLRPGFGRIVSESADVWLPSLGVLGPMARSVADLALLLSVQAGFDARAPLSLDGEGPELTFHTDLALKGRRIAWGGDLAGHAPCEAEVLAVCERALDTLEALGYVVESALPEFDLEALWQATVRLRAWQNGAALRQYHAAPAQRALLKPEAVFEIETGASLSAYDISAASELRSAWYEALRRFFERYDFLVLPSAQVLPFDAREHWPRQIAGQSMRTYHEWMKMALLVSMSGCPALAAPAGFSAHGLPVGIQIVAPIRGERDCLALAYAYEAARGERAPLPPALA